MGEKAGERYDRSQWTGVGKMEMDAVADRERKRVEGLSRGKQLGEWAGKNRYGIIGSA